MTIKSKLSRDDVLQILRQHKPILKDRFDITEISLYGSFARDEATEQSDVDVVVEFGESPDWIRYFDAQSYLVQVTGRSVDMARRQDLRTEIRHHVLNEAIDV